MEFKTGDVIADRPSWWLYDDRHELIAWAGEMFASLTDADAAAAHFAYGASRARFELYQDRTGAWRWRAHLGDTLVASGSEGFHSEIAARRAANTVRDNVARATPAPGRLRATAHG